MADEVNKKYFRGALSHYRLDGKKKKSFESEKDAILTCYKLNLKESQTRKLVAYKCCECHKWHIGKNSKILTEEDREEIREKMNIAKILECKKNNY